MLKHSHNNDDPRVICESLSKYHYHRTAHHRSRLLSLTEIALAGARKVKLKILAEAGEERAQKYLIYKNNLQTFCSVPNRLKCCCNLRWYIG